MCTCAHICREVGVRCLPQLDSKSVTELGACWFVYTGWSTSPKDPPFCAFHALWYAKVRGQLAGLHFLLPVSGSRRSNLGYQSWQKTSLSANPSLCSQLCVWFLVVQAWGHKVSPLEPTHQLSHLPSLEPPLLNERIWFYSYWHFFSEQMSHSRHMKIRLACFQPAFPDHFSSFFQLLL